MNAAPIRQHSKKQKSRLGGTKTFGGERGIRTPGSVTFNSFQDCRNRPLCHFSAAKVEVFAFVWQKHNNFYNS